MRIEISSEAQAFRHSGRYRFYSWWGLRPYDKNVLVWARKATDKGSEGIIRIAKRWIKKKTIGREYFIDILQLNKSNVKVHFENMLAHKPKFIRGYMSAILQLAELIRELQLDGKSLKLRIIIVTSEVLMPDNRKYIEETFGCKVANEYGSAEVGLIAFECPNGRMHIFEEAVLLQEADDGVATVTELHNNNMVLLNYINGDKVRLADIPCNCGRSLKVLDQIEGRLADTILTTNGEQISQYLFYYAVKELDDIGLRNSITKYKVIQTKNLFNFYIVKGPNYSEEVRVYLEKRTKNQVGDSIIIKFHFVDEIERERSGKLRFFVRER